MTRPTPAPASRTHRALLALAAVLPFVLGTPASAAEPVRSSPAAATSDTTVTWGVRPGAREPHAADRPNFAYTAAPGTTVADSLVVTNHGDTDTTLRVYAADAFTTGQGVLDLRRPDDRATGVGAWTVLDVPEVVVPAGGTVEVPFTVTVPEDAEPGDHAGGVVTSLVSTRADGVGVDRRLGSRLHLRVEGPLAPGVALEGTQAVHHGDVAPTDGSVDVGVDVVNTGNVRVAGPATVTVAGPFGLGAREVQVDVPELLPGERTTVAVDVADVPALGVLTATVRYAPVVVVDGSQASPAVASTTVVAVPWAVLAVLLLVVGGVVAGRVGARRRAAATDRRVAEALATAGVDPAQVEEHAGV